jgi:hypothetical protein
VPISDFYRVFPNLEDSPHRETSDPDLDYNCMSWAVEDKRNWEPWGIIVPAPPPEYHWPVEDHSGTVRAYTLALATKGYAPCENGLLEEGVTKIALYTVGDDVRHVARQLPSGRWTSKIGRAEDIEHTLEALYGGPPPYEYGEATHFFSRQNAPPRRRR